MLLAEIREGDVEFRLDKIVGLLREADAAWRCQSLQADRQVDAVAVDVVLLDDDVAEVNADAKTQATVLRLVSIAGVLLTLPRKGAGGGVDDALEGDEETVSRLLDQPAAVFVDQWND